MTEISFSDICRALKRMQLPEFDLVVGIAQGGVVPAALVAAQIGCDLKVVRVSYRKADNTPAYPEPLVMGSLELAENSGDILLVDDVTISGKTLQAAKHIFNKQKIKTMVLRGRADYVVFPGLSTCLSWPWRY